MALARRTTHDFCPTVVFYTLHRLKCIVLLRSISPILNACTALINERMEDGLYLGFRFRFSEDGLY